MNEKFAQNMYIYMDIIAKIREIVKRICVYYEKKLEYQPEFVKKYGIKNDKYGYLCVYLCDFIQNERLKIYTL